MLASYGQLLPIVAHWVARVGTHRMNPLFWLAKTPF